MSEINQWLFDILPGKVHGDIEFRIRWIEIHSYKSPMNRDFQVYFLDNKWLIFSRSAT